MENGHFCLLAVFPVRFHAYCSPFPPLPMVARLGGIIVLLRSRAVRPRLLQPRTTWRFVVETARAARSYPPLLPTDSSSSASPPGMLALLIPARLKSPVVFPQRPFATEPFFPRGRCSSYIPSLSRYRVSEILASRHCLLLPRLSLSLKVILRLIKWLVVEIT